MSEPFITFGAPALGEEEIEEVLRSLRSGWLGTGPKVARFEGDFAKYKGVPESRVAAVNSCTAALHLSMIASGVGPGDEVITTAMTFAATVNSIIHCGATPVLVDVEAGTMNMDPKQLSRALSPRTRAIIPVHFGGRCCDMDAIMEFAKAHQLVVVEDCAHAIESEYRGKRAGTLGDFGCFSFYVTKNVVTGEGGMVLARADEAIAKVKILALHGMSKDAWRRFSDEGYKHYQVVACGFKYNMMDLQAAIGIHQLARVEKNWLRRRAIWDRYQQEFKDLPVVRPEEPAADLKHGYHLYTLLIDETVAPCSRDSFLEQMTRRQIGVGVHYLSIPEHPYYQETYGWKPEDYPCAMRIGRQTVSLPISPKLSDDDITRICSAVRGILTC